MYSERATRASHFSPNQQMVLVYPLLSSRLGRAVDSGAVTVPRPCTSPAVPCTVARAVHAPMALCTVVRGA